MAVINLDNIMSTGTVRQKQYSPKYLLYDDQYFWEMILHMSKINGSLVSSIEFWYSSKKKGDIFR